MDDALRNAYHQAADLFVKTVAAVPPDAWDRPGLDRWSVRSLVGHAARSLLLVEQYLRPSGVVTLASGADYLHAASAGWADPAAVTARGEEAGRALGDDPAQAVLDLWPRIAIVVDEAPPGAVVETPMGTLTLEAYLPTRVVELVVHSIDVADALGVAIELPEQAASLALTALLANAAGHSGWAVPLLRTLTGRAPLPADFRLVP